MFSNLFAKQSFTLSNTPNSVIALLAGIPNAPSVYSPMVNSELAQQRQQYVIRQMVKYGYISESEGEIILSQQP